MLQKMICFLILTKSIFVAIITMLCVSPQAYTAQDDNQTLVTQSSSSCNSTSSYVDDPYQLDVRSQTCEIVQTWIRSKIQECDSPNTPLMKVSDENVDALSHLENPNLLYAHCSFYICANITWQIVTTYNHTWEEFWKQELCPFIEIIYILNKKFKFNKDRSHTQEQVGKSDTFIDPLPQDCKECLLELMVTILTNFEGRFYKELMTDNDLA